MIKILTRIVIGLVALVLVAVGIFHIYYNQRSAQFMEELGPTAPTLSESGFTFRDLNKNGALDPYEDRRLSVEVRVENLLSQMSLEEKAGLMFITMIVGSEDGSLLEKPTPSNPFSFISPINSEMVIGLKMNHFNLMGSSTPRAMAQWHNNLQELAERTRLGIPVTLASDPRHAFSNNPAASMMAGPFSQWPEALGLAAIGDSLLTATFADIARQEYMAAGIRLALHPQADLATEPRWPRINGTFGEDADLASKMVYAYIMGLQGDTLSTQSVATMAKHFPGAGPQLDGLDPHLEIGKEQVYPGQQFDYHLIPFEKGVLPAHAAQIMPYYGIPVGQTDEQVGFAFNKAIITDLLRGQYGFDGVICTDWALLTDKKIYGFTLFEAMGWGVEDLPPVEKAKRALAAGVDQFGGETGTELIVELVQSGQVPESRIDTSVRRLLRDKFTLGLFDDPYVDVDRATQIIGRADFMEAGLQAQRRSIVLLKNSDLDAKKALPITGKPNIYVENIDPEVANQYGTVVPTPIAADIAILRLSTPHETIGEGMFASMMHQGALDFEEEERTRILGILNTIPTVVDIYMDRPAVVPEIADQSAALLANFGASDEALLDVIFGFITLQAGSRSKFHLPCPK